MAHHIKTTYISGWYTVGIPLIIFFLFFLGMPISVMAIYHWNIPSWVGISLYIIGCVLGLAANVIVYPFVMRVASRAQGELILEDKVLKWRKGIKWHEVDMSRNYQAKIAVGLSGLGENNASVSLEHSKAIIHMREAERSKILQLFPESYFLDDMAITPAEGLWGFELHIGDEASRAFFTDLLLTLWETRDNNEHYSLYRKFPWDYSPRPNFHYIETIDKNEMSPDQHALLEELNSQVISAPTFTAKATKDYLIGNDGGDKYFIFPLGHISAEETISGSSEDSIRYLKIKGIDKSGQKTIIKLPYWVQPGDEQYNESRFFLRFINRKA